jgi:hypothetical protein
VALLIESNNAANAFLETVTMAVGKFAITKKSFV